MIDCASCKYRKDSRTSLWCQDCLKKGKMYFSLINEPRLIEVKSSDERSYYESYCSEYKG